MASASMISHLQQNVSFIIPIWKMTAAGTTTTPLVSAVTVGSVRNNFTGWVGFKFNTGANTPTVSGLGRWRVSGNTATHTVRIYKSDLTQIATVNIDMSSGTVGAFKYAAITPVALLANTNYYLLSQETNTGDQWYDDDSTGIALNSSIGTLLNSASSTNPAVLISDSGLSKMYGPVNLQIDGAVAAYAAHTRDVRFDSVHYKASAVEATRFSQTLGLNANHVELFGVLDDTVTEPDLQAGRWKNAKITFEYISYDPETGAASATVIGSVGKIKGQAGKFTINNGTYTVEVRSLSDLLHQEVGSLTSPLDRNRSPEALGVAMGPFTFARTVTGTPPDKRNFTVTGATFSADYLKYGRVEWSTGANAGLQMEIKANVGNVVELQLPMRSVIANGDTCNLIAGYDSTREQARDKFNAMDNFRGEPDLPGLTKAILTYPE